MLVGPNHHQRDRRMRQQCLQGTGNAFTLKTRADVQEHRIIHANTERLPHGLPVLLRKVRMKDRSIHAVVNHGKPFFRHAKCRLNFPFDHVCIANDQLQTGIPEHFPFCPTNIMMVGIQPQGPAPQPSHGLAAQGQPASMHAISCPINFAARYPLV